jgi:hypothetical protein
MSISKVRPGDGMIGFLNGMKRRAIGMESAPSTTDNKASDEIAALKSAVESLRSDLSSLRGSFHDFVQLHERIDGFDYDI